MQLKGQVQLCVISTEHEVNAVGRIVERLCVKGKENRAKDRPLGDAILQDLIL